jgi:tryptophan 7-halogenase
MSNTKNSYSVEGMKPIRKIVIVGGGTSGWIAASMLSYHLKSELCHIELVESDELSTIGIGESTIPPVVRLIQNLGIDEKEFIQSTQACFKLGIKFVDWRQKNETYFHPFGVIGKRIGSYDFYQCWLKARMQGDTSELQDFSPCSVMAEQERFFWPTHMQNTPIGGASYAVHLDSKLVVDYLSRFSKARGVKRTEGTVSRVTQCANGNIEKLILDNGEEVEGDFFIDCTGFRALLIEKTLSSGFEDWSHFLPCDRAVVVKTEAKPLRKPYTTATAQKHGWSWHIPLRNSTGHGYVYSSKFCSDAEAKSNLLKNLDGARINDPRIIPFATGRRKEMWKNNCLSLGLASGFVEPLESTSIHLIARGMDFFLRFFPDRDCDPSLLKEYNRRMAADFEEVRDFIILHYCTTQREDTPFWRACKNRELPESLKERIALFKGHGVLREGTDELFRSSSWQSVFEGMGIRPQKYCQRVDNIDFQEITETLKVAKQAIHAMVKTLPTHDEFLHNNYHQSSDDLENKISGV